MFNKPKFLASSLMAVYALSGSLHAADYSNTSFYVAYDSQDSSQYALVMPSVQKVYTHVAGDIANLERVDTDLVSFPTYTNGNLCFPSLANGVSVDATAAVMANKCFNVNFFYTQKETVAEGTAFILYYEPTDKVYEGIAGDSLSFEVVKEGDTVTNENSITGDDYTNFSFDVGTASATIADAVTKEEITGTITTNTTLTADKVWLLNGKVEVADGVVLTVEPGTTVAGKSGTNGWLLVHPGAQLNASGTSVAPILFTSEEAVDGAAEAFGQWGGITLIGNAGNDQTSAYEVDGTVPGTGNDTDSSGVLTYVTLNNTGVEVVTNQEINGLSFVGVGSGTTVDNITVNRSGDDGIEIWGGTVNLTNIVIDGAQDDSFDTDEGWAGSVDGLTITNGAKAGIEMSGSTRATYKNVTITHGAGDGAEGGIYFKPSDNQVIGGVFENVTITHNGADAAFGAIHSRAKTGSSIDLLTTFTNVTLAGTNPTKFSGDEAAVLEAIFDNGTGNTK
ncbi:right-handed parallel beta-helix repeat-containing protein [Sulfurovum sp.]|uniref:right-handed parallel beta-helix repeat-containing protein n=1 Tax=Sulfurovum sp. TaxID=1969726 RepID=UPI003567FEC6